MLKINRLREFLAETKSAIAGINFAELVIDDSQFIKFLKDRKESDNCFLIGVVPQFPLTGSEDKYKWNNQLQFFILKKRSDRITHDEILLNMQATQDLVNDFVELLLGDNVGEAGTFCGLPNELSPGSLLVYPVWEKAQCDGWTIEIDLLTIA